MWRRALLAAAAVSYLICVLIMSGMQKEDLDVSMLRKLEQYNVNFDDINNERLRHQCTSRNSEYTTDDQRNKLNADHVSTTISSITTKDPLPSDSWNMETVLNYLKTQKGLIRNSVEITTEKTTYIHQDTVTPVMENIENRPKINLDLLGKYIHLHTQNKSVYKSDDKSETTEHDTTINLKPNERNSNVANDVVFIDNLFKEYLLHRQKIPTTTEYTTRYTVDIKNVYKQIDEIIANGSYIDHEEDITRGNYLSKAGRSNIKNDEVTSPGQVTSENENRYMAGKRLYQSFYNFIREMNQYKNISSQALPIFDDKPYTAQTSLYTPLKPLNEDEQEKHSESITTITPNYVKKIAESIKEVIIKDLHSELANIYLKTTQTSTQIISTTTQTTEVSPTTSKNRTQENDISLLDKIKELYEQIKILKQATVSLKPNNESSMFMNNSKLQPKTPRNSPFLMPPVNGLLMPYTKASIPSINNYNIKPFVNQNSYMPRQVNNHQLPRTIQTNSVEIQPLAVRMSKPESMIRQNIVIQSAHRVQGRNDHLRGMNPRGNSYLSSDIPKRNINKYSPLNRYIAYNSERYPIYRYPQEPKRNEREDVIRFRMRDNGNSRFDTDYYEKINFDNDQNAVKEKHGIFNNRNIPRFHERLERIESGSDGAQIVSDINMKNKKDETNFPQRQQMSLIEMKKGSPYDDTHFKNFLNTQQKVTDMLERILANRPKANLPRSVETI